MQMTLTKNRRRISWLIALMTLSLMGIAGIQAYWLNNAFRLAEEKFDSKVAEALNGVSGRIENLETIRILYDNMKLEPFFSAKANPLMGIEGERDSALRIQPAEGAYQIAYRLQSDSIDIYENKMQSLPGLYYYSQDTSYRLALEDRKKLAGKFQNVDMLINQLLVHSLEKNSKGLRGRMSHKNIDSILDFELRSAGISLPYEYVVEEENNVVYASTGWDSSMATTHQAALFPNDFFEHSTLKVNFPGKTNYLLRSMWLTLLFSILFTCAIIFTFYKTVIFSLQQKRISEVKTDFINNMTHEFKTPIATINLAIDALKNAKVLNDPQRVKHFSEVIKQENNRMNMQVESVLRIALMDKKELDLNFEKVKLGDLIRDCSRHIELALQSKGGHLKIEHFNEEQDLRIDRNHVCNTIINILDNAIKYSGGTPEIRLASQRTREHLILIISDKGIGMSRDEQKHIFDRFYRVGSGNIHNIKGHGLGLSYAAGIMEAHGGKIEVESEKGKGSSFYLYFPLN